MAKDRQPQPKMTPTTRHILTTPPDEAVELLPPDRGQIPEGRRPVVRLGLRATPQYRYDAADLVNAITHPNWDPVILCDTNCFIARTDQLIWPALLERRLGLVPPIIHELSSWLQNPTNNGFVRDQVAKMLMHEEGTPFEVVQFDGEDRIARTCIEYYVNLLGFRNCLFDILEIQFAEQHRRQPTNVEVEALAKRFVGERGYQRGRKGRKSAGAGQPFADEVLVVTAFLHAIATGEEVLLLTRDPDIQEQFYKMQWLLDTHYRSMLLAESYAAEPTAFETTQMPKDEEMVREAFTGDDDLLLERDGQTLFPVLPTIYRPVSIYCWLLKGEGEHATVTQTTFCAEQEMIGVFRTKGVTAGLNTDKLGGKNLHIWLSPLPFQPLGRWAAVVNDYRFVVQSARIPLLDIQHTMNTDERLRRILLAGESHDDLESALPGGTGIGNEA